MYSEDAALQPDFWRNSGFHLLERDPAGRLRHLLTLVLERAGYVVVTAPDGRAALIELKRDAGSAALSFLQEVQRDPITDRYLHVDLQEVKENEKMVINVAVQVAGNRGGSNCRGNHRRRTGDCGGPFCHCAAGVAYH